MTTSGAEMAGEGGRPADGESTSEVVFTNVKGLRRFTVHMREMIVLVGPNNAGKSTVIGAFRVLSAGLQAAAVDDPNC